MGARLVFNQPPPLSELKSQLAKAGVSLSKQQQDFIEEHGTHRGLSIDGQRVYCRTCNQRDGQ